MLGYEEVKLLFLLLLDLWIRESKLKIRRPTAQNERKRVQVYIVRCLHMFKM